MMKEVNQFILVESVAQVLKEATEQLGLKTLEGKAPEPDFEKTIDEMLKEFDVGKPYTLDCTISLQKERKKDEVGEHAAVDAEATTVANG